MRSPRLLRSLAMTSYFLFKSILVLLIYFILLVFWFVYRDVSSLRNKWFWLSNVLMLVLILPWHLYEASIFGQTFWDHYVIQHIFSRVNESVLAGEPAPFFYQLQQLFVVNQPWLLCFVILASLFLIKQRNKLRQYTAELFSLLVTLSVLVFFHIPQTKLLYYFTPMLPFMAMFLGSYLAVLMKTHKNLFVFFLILLSIGFLSTSLRIFSDRERGFFLEPEARVSRYEIAQDEKTVVKIVQQ